MAVFLSNLGFSLIPAPVLARYSMCSYIFKGLHMTTLPFTVNLDGHEFKGRFEYEREEPETDIDPCIPAIATVLTVFIDSGKVDCYDIVNPATIQRIEANLLDAML